jgi:hypothetical protein
LHTDQIRKWNNAVKKEAIFYAFIFLLVLCSTAAGVFYGTSSFYVESATLRGQRALFQGSGIYRYNPVVLAREGIVWDTVNLFVGLPLFAAAIFFSLRNSLRGRLMLGGLLAYFWYVYLMGAIVWAFNNFFLVYVLIFSLSMVAFAVNGSHIDLKNLPHRVSARFPRGLFIGYCFVLSGALVLLWMGRIIPVMRSGLFPDELAGLTTLQTQAIDLGFVVPLLLSAGVLLRRRSPWGYFLSSMTVTFGLMMCISIPAWIVVPLVQDGRINLAEALPFAVLSLTGIVLTIMFYRSISKNKTADASVNGKGI